MKKGFFAGNWMVGKMLREALNLTGKTGHEIPVVVGRRADWRLRHTCYSPGTFGACLLLAPFVGQPDILAPRLLRGYSDKNTKKIAEYLQNQLKEDQIADQMTLKEYADPFKTDK